MNTSSRLVNWTNGSLVSLGRKRTYLLHVPETYDPAAPTPLVISLHGFIEWPAHLMRTSHWNDLASQYGFIVVYPCGTGVPLRWRTHAAPGSDSDPMQDVTFLSDLIDKLGTEYNLDPARIYVNGFSNGGGMAFVLACHLSERIAAIGSIAGAYTISWRECHPAQQVPAILFHGTKDPIVPYLGGTSGGYGPTLPSVPEWVASLVSANGFAEAPVPLPAIGDVSGIQFLDCASKGTIVFYTIANGGHSWPGGGAMPKFIVGSTNRDINATQMMWDFFQQHVLMENVRS
jgi:polyhydroxybutyrate depolymerase